MDNGASAEKLTFEQGYEELKRIVARLDESDVTVHEMFESFRRGKGLETALRNYLETREGELKEIEEGKNLPDFEIVASSGAAAAGAAASSIASASASDASGDEQIPF
jgi:exodeoxyribonuclease VII small subunit